jgi:hypothetical protein
MSLVEVGIEKDGWTGVKDEMKMSEHGDDE